MRAVVTHRLWTALMLISLVLAACSSKSTSIPSSKSVSTASAQETNTYAQALAEILLKSTQDYLSEDPEVLGYHAVLMLARAADLIVAYGEKVKADQIQLSDASARHPYTDAFPVAVDTFNKTTPPRPMVNAWKMVFKVIQQYNQAYEAEIKGIPLASTDLARLKTSRQLLTNYQDIAEANLTSRGLGPDFLTAKQDEVEQHFQEAYGNEPVPALQP